jgi:hypothetical protein
MRSDIGTRFTGRRIVGRRVVAVRTGRAQKHHRWNKLRLSIRTIVHQADGEQMQKHDVTNLG